MAPQDPQDFERAAQESSRGVIAEFLAFIVENKKFWMIPILLALAAVGAMIILGGTAAAPFIYTLF